MTRRCSVIRMPVAAQRASIPEELSAGVVFKEVIISRLTDALSATRRSLRQVPPHQKRIQLFPSGLNVIALPAAHGRKSGAFIESAGRLIVFLDFEKHGPDSTACQMPEMGQQQITRKASAALIWVKSDRQNLGFVGPDA